MASLSTKTYVSPSTSPLVDRGLKIEVVSASGMPKEIFVWQRVPAVAGVPSGGDLFVGIATPSDLADIPAQTPEIANEMPYYRDAELELWFRNDSDLEYYRSAIQRQINQLVVQLNTLATLPLESETTYPIAE